MVRMFVDVTVYKRMRTKTFSLRWEQVLMLVYNTVWEQVKNV